MSIFDYQAAIKVTFDKEIVSDPEIITGTEYYEVKIPYESAWTFISSGDNASYPKQSAIDGNTSTYWQSSSTAAPQWIGKDFGQSVTLDSVRVSMEYSSGRINAYEIQGSDDGITYNTVASGNFTNASGYQVKDFTPTTYRYWRLYATSKFSSYYTVSELEFCVKRNTYNVAGWTVTGTEYNFNPDGTTRNETYTVRKVTKAPDNLSVTLWLEMSDRMRSPAGDVTVSYDKLLGNLLGDFDAQVESFQVTFTPTNIVRYDNPHGEEHLSAAANMTVSVMEVAYKYIPAESNTFLIVDYDNPYMDEHLSATANMTVVVTKVGDLPL